MKFDQDSGIAELWVDASSSSDSSITGSTPSSGTSIDSFALRQSNSSTDETVTVDNLIIGQTFDEVLGASTSTQVTVAITYNWTNDNTAIGLAASGTGDIPSFTASLKDFFSPLIFNLSIPGIEGIEVHTRNKS